MKIGYKITISAYLLLIIPSCKKSFLEIQPFGSLSEEILANEAGLNKLLIGAYACVNGVAVHGGGAVASDAYIFGCDENRIGTSIGASENDAFLWEASGGAALGGNSLFNDKWMYYYGSIGRTNDILRIMPDVQNTDPKILLQIEAETKFLRGYFYFKLITYFKNVPWIDESVTYAEKNYLVPNNENVWPKVESDLEFAADNLTETKSEVGRANKWAAKALLAKTYVYQYKYSEAKSLLEDIIANGQTSNGLKYELLDRYNDNFIRRTANGSEGVFVMQQSVGDGQLIDYRGNPLDKYGGTYGAPANAGGAGWMQPTFDLVDAFQTDPVAGLPLLDTYQDLPIPNDNGLSASNPFTPYSGTLDSRLDWCVGRRGIPYRDWGVFPGGSWVRSQFNSGPYVAIKNTAEQSRAETDKGLYGSTNNPYNLIRFADVLLWAAECEVEAGSLNKAEQYVNMIRTRAANPEGFVHTYTDPNDPLKGFTNIPAANYKVGLYNGQFEANGKSYARKAIFFERRLEFAMEHHRFFDLVRYDGIEGDNFDVAATLNSFMQRERDRISNPVNLYKIGKFTKGKNEICPIPQIQIDLSVKDGEPVLKQNPLY